MNRCFDCEHFLDYVLTPIQRDDGATSMEFGKDFCTGETPRNSPLYCREYNPPTMKTCVLCKNKTSITNGKQQNFSFICNNCLERLNKACAELKAIDSKGGRKRALRE